MNRVEELHEKAFVSTQIGEDVQSNHAKVTKDVSVGFTEWILKEGFYTNGGYWTSANYERVFELPELYDYFVINGHINTL